MPIPPPAPARPVPPHPPDEESPDLIDWALLRNYIGFALRAPRRRPLLAASAFAGVVALAFAGLWAFPKTYRAETRILAQRNPVMSSIANPSMGRPWEADAPTRAARETVLRWDNLVALVKQTDLVKSHLASRPPISRLRDDIIRRFSGRDPTQDELVESLAYTLEKRLSVDVTEGLVILRVDWNDADSAYRLVEAALQNFLEARHASEISIVGEAISILEAHAAGVQREVSALEEQVTQLQRAGHSQVAGTTTKRTTTPAPARSSPQDDDLMRLRGMLAAKQRAIADLEEFRQKRLAELQAHLAQQRAIYADMHPAVISTRQSIDALSGPSPQIEALRAEARDLERDMIKRGAGSEVRAESGPAVTRIEVVEHRTPPSELESPQLTEARGQLRLRYSKLASLHDRIDSARMEMDTAQAAFKYRYVVISPPQMPKYPVKPRATLVRLGGVLGGFLFAFFAASVADLRSGRLVERWQVERRLGVPVLAEIRR